LTQNRKKSALSDQEAKALLEQTGIALPPERFVSQQAEVAAAADSIGYPVVLKGIGTKLMHKTERGLVHLKLNDSRALEAAARMIRTEAGEDLEGFLVQPHMSGRREFVAGLLQDPQFGPVVLFGIGGVLTEAFADVAAH
jgi:acyl-CoA synthetase (NDP forming)